MTIRQRLREEKRKKERGLPNRYNKAHEAYLKVRYPAKDVYDAAVEFKEAAEDFAEAVDLLVSSETGAQEEPLNSQLSSEEDVN